MREKSAVLINQANISRLLALYATRTVLSCLVICYPLNLKCSSGIEVQAKCVLCHCLQQRSAPGWSRANRHLLGREVPGGVIMGHLLVVKPTDDSWAGVRELGADGAI